MERRTGRGAQPVRTLRPVGGLQLWFVVPPTLIVTEPCVLAVPYTPVREGGCSPGWGGRRSPPGALPSGPQASAFLRGWTRPSSGGRPNPGHRLRAGDWAGITGEARASGAGRPARRSSAFGDHSSVRSGLSTCLDNKQILTFV